MKSSCMDTMSLWWSGLGSIGGQVAQLLDHPSSVWKVPGSCPGLECCIFSFPFNMFKWLEMLYEVIMHRYMFACVNIDSYNKYPQITSQIWLYKQLHLRCDKQPVYQYFSGSRRLYNRTMSACLCLHFTLFSAIYFIIICILIKSS